MAKLEGHGDIKVNARQAHHQLTLTLQAHFPTCRDMEDWLITIGEALDQLDALKAAASVIAKRQITLSTVADRPIAFCHDCGLSTFNPKENDPPHTEHCPTGVVLRIIEGGEETA